GFEAQAHNPKPGFAYVQAPAVLWDHGGDDGLRSTHEVWLGGGRSGLADVVRFAGARTRPGLGPAILPACAMSCSGGKAKGRRAGYPTPAALGNAAIGAIAGPRA